MKELITTNIIIFVIDNEDFERISSFKWFESKSFIFRKFILNGEQHIIPLANEIMQKLSVKFDHKDRNFKNNSKINLRECSNAQNLYNREKLSNSKSPFKGITFDKNLNKWRAKIHKNRKTIHIGSFLNPTDAARAYDFKAKELHGEFAVLNFPEIISG